MEMTKEQQVVMDEILRWFKEQKNQFITVSGDAGTGKEMPIDTPIKTPSGDVLKGDLKIGDYVIGSNGKPTKVIGIHPQGTKQSYTVTFRDKTTIECGLDHLWSIYTPKLKTNKRPPITLSLRELMDRGVKSKSGSNKFYIPLCDPVDYTHKELPIHPYIVGVCIGDGSNLGKSPLISTPDMDRDIIDYIQTLIPDYITITENRSSACPQYRLKDADTYHGNRFASFFGDMGLGVKSVDRFIPQTYMFGSIDQRMDLLKGLMDSDGTSRGNRIGFSTKSERLCGDVIELVQSLGGTAIKRVYDRREKGIEYDVNVKMFKNPFMSKRKSSNWRFSSKNPPSRAITNIKPCRMVDQVCITVDAPDNLFLVDNYIVTHNSFLLSCLPKLLPPTIRIAYGAFTGKASSVLLEKLKTANVWSVNVSTIHKLIYMPKIRKEEDGTEYIDGWELNEDLPYDLIVIDEASMVGKQLFNDLAGYGIPILAVGDDFQLQPVGDEGFSLMVDTDLALKKVHRLAKGNPIIMMSQYIRKHGVLPRELNTTHSKELFWYKKGDREFINKIPYQNKGIVTLAGMNKTRKNLNNYIRGLCGYQGADIINAGERVVCLKNNDMLVGRTPYDIMNGMLGTVKSIVNTKNSTIKRIHTDFDVYGDTIPCECDVRSFGEINASVLAKISGDPGNKEIAHKKGQKAINMFDYGYVLTVHKAQGSEYKAVVLVDERNYYSTDEDYARWLYTAVTRSSNKLFVIKGYS